jgi:NAD(P)-dependent dehydrogenase (short-subunit alcohol dehydrogenase family)
MTGILQDKIALVTGGGSGIGQASALIFAREGAKVVVADIDPNGGEETVSQIKNTGGDAIYIHADVSKASEVESMVMTAVDSYGRLDCAFNNAGIGAGGVTHEYTEETWDRVMSINLKGIWLCMKYEIPHMLSQGAGAIVNMSSGLGLVGVKDQAVYVASKHGVVGLSKGAALDYAQLGIRVNAICPGWTRTPLSEEGYQDPEIRAFYLDRQPIGRIQQPQEIAEAVVWLCSDKASSITGLAMAVDGGWTVH